ncbi:hypothetical protein AB4Z54_66845 [Streptomyces sp. MCAF7]
MPSSLRVFILTITVVDDFLAPGDPRRGRPAHALQPAGFHPHHHRGR